MTNPDTGWPRVLWELDPSDFTENDPRREPLCQWIEAHGLSRKEVLSVGLSVIDCYDGSRRINFRRRWLREDGMPHLIPCEHDPDGYHMAGANDDVLLQHQPPDFVKFADA